MFPEDLKVEAAQAARQDNTTFGEFVRRALKKYLLLRKNQRAQDSFLGSQTRFDDQGPKDVAENHDTYLTEADPHGRST
jgi:hypothetical protein